MNRTFIMVRDIREKYPKALELLRLFYNEDYEDDSDKDDTDRILDSILLESDSRYLYDFFDSTNILCFITPFVNRKHFMYEVSTIRKNKIRIYAKNKSFKTRTEAEFSMFLDAFKILESVTVDNTVTDI